MNCRQWKTKLRTYARGWPTRIPDCCTCSKHGLSLASTLAPGDSGQQPSNTMLIRHEAIFIPPGSTTPKLQNPLRVPWKFTLLNETRLRGNATATQGGAAYVLSMVSTLRACQFQGIWDGKTQTPCLACMLHTVPWGSRLDKHGFRSRHAPAPGGLNCHQ